MFRAASAVLTQKSLIRTEYAFSTLSACSHIVPHKNVAFEACVSRLLAVDNWAFVLAVIGSVVSVGGLIQALSVRNADRTIMGSALRDIRVETLMAEIHVLESKIGSLQAKDQRDVAMASGVGEILVMQIAIDKRLDVLETGIAGDPERYFSAPPA